MSDLRALGAPPFELIADIELPASPGQSLKGTYHLFWISESKWREEISLGKYKRLRIGAEGMYWQSRTGNVESLPVYLLSDLVDFPGHLRERSQQLTSRIKLGQSHGLAVRCISHNAKSEGPPDTEEEFCFDAGQGTLAELRWPAIGIETRGVTASLFSVYVEVRDKKFPRTIKITLGSKPGLVLSITKLGSLEKINADDFVSPPGARVWPSCKTTETLPLVHQVIPLFIGEFKGDVYGAANVYGIVGKDGHLSDAKLLSAPEPSLGDASLRAVQKWRFPQPGCGGGVAEREIVVEIVFAVRD